MLSNRFEVAGVRIPDTEAASGANALALIAMPEALYNHCLRTFVLARLDADRRQLRVDVEGGFIASILHDIALVEEHSGDLALSFEENGAALAREYALKQDFPAGRAQTIAKSILLHAGRAGGQSPDVQFVMQGARQDVFGPSPTEVTEAQLWALEREVPRLNFRREFLTLLNAHVARTQKPTWTQDFASNPPQNFLTNRWLE